MRSMKELRDEAETRMFGKTMPEGSSESIARISFRAGWDAAAEELGYGESGTPTAADPWDEFRREAALEMVRHGHASSSNGVLFIVKMVNSLVEELKKEKK